MRERRCSQYDCLVLNLFRFNGNRAKFVGSTHLPLDLKALAQSRPSFGVRTVDSESGNLLARSLVAGTACESKASKARGEG